MRSVDGIDVWRRSLVAGPDGPLHVLREHETHTAWVFLTATHAFKLRKPVDLGFLDYSSEEKRRRAARSEVALGRRISSHLYPGIWSLRNGEGPLLSLRDDEGEPIVVMRRLPDELQLGHKFKDPHTSASCVDDVAVACARFHATCPIDRRIDGYGAVANTVAAWTVNFAQLRASDETIPLTASERRQLVLQTEHWIERLRPLFTARISQGCIREGHGDLRLEHVFLTSPWSVIDPLEFSVELRFCDVAAEVCFLAMELDDLGRRDASDRLLARYAEATQDSTLTAVAPFFKRYRAVVRAKVEWLQACQKASPDREPKLAASRRLFELALAY